MKTITSLFVLLVCNLAHSQVYTEKHTRHRFAQLNLGADLLSGFGGSTKYIDLQGKTQAINLSSAYTPRFLIGGTHFWGHADFYIAIPLFSSTLKENNQVISAHRGVETVFKYYPFRIENHKIRPYIGTALTPFYFEQQNNNFQYPGGHSLNHTCFPLLGGLTLNAKSHLIELGIAWNYRNQKEYYISRTQKEKISTPPVYVSVSYRCMLETTLSAEKDWESGRTKKLTDILAERGRLNGLYVGAGISSAFWLTQSSYNLANRPYMGAYGISTMPDFTFGYYFHKPDINVAIGYRGYGASAESYGTFQQLNRKSLLFEATKGLFDYHGFVPFVGPAISYENLAFQEDFEGQKTVDVDENKLGYGLTFGWDIRPNRIQSWILRTNLRWYPHLFIEVEPASKVSFNNLEFNFIQLIIYPNRMINQMPGRN